MKLRELDKFARDMRHRTIALCGPCFSETGLMQGTPMNEDDARCTACAADEVYTSADVGVSLPPHPILGSFYSHGPGMLTLRRDVVLDELPTLLPVMLDQVEAVSPGLHFLIGVSDETGYYFQLEMDDGSDITGFIKQAREQS